MFGLALALMVEDSLAAAPLALSPLSRVTAGLTWVGGPSPIGFSGSFESRLTPVVAAEFGGFFTPVPMAPGLEDSLGDGEDLFYLRHGLYGDLGFRIPHRQPIKFGWDFHFRIGSGVVWGAHVSNDALLTDDTNYDIAASLGVLAGGDLLFRFGKHLGVRGGGRAWGFQVVDQQEFISTLKVSPQVDLGLLYQW